MKKIDEKEFGYILEKFKETMESLFTSYDDFDEFFVTEFSDYIGMSKNALVNHLKTDFDNTKLEFKIIDNELIDNKMNVILHYDDFSITITFEFDFSGNVCNWKYVMNELLIIQQALDELRKNK